ncbi:MAG: FliM/FliN family flagellar motor switch protein [Marinosulfonomonas sp.]|nr:FliM/FliN family flagellar motor switch protein [Marinosulfonomonas sp.]
MDDTDNASVSTNSAQPAESPFGQVPVEIAISVGRAHPLVSDLLKLQLNSVLPLDQRIEDPVDLFVGDRLIARGELLEMDGDMAGRLAVRLTEIAEFKNGL